MSRRKVSPNANRWRKVRVIILDRDGWKCVQCGRRAGLCVDHIIPISEGGDMYSESNLQTLCAFPCHNNKTRLENSPPVPHDVQEWQDYINAVA